MWNKRFIYLVGHSSDENIISFFSRAVICCCSLGSNKWPEIWSSLQLHSTHWPSDVAQQKTPNWTQPSAEKISHNPIDKWNRSLRSRETQGIALCCLNNNIFEMTEMLENTMVHSLYNSMSLKQFCAFKQSWKI